MSPVKSIAVTIVVALLAAVFGALGGMEWSDRACETAESNRIAAEKTANEQSAIDSMALIGDLYADLERQAPAVAGYQRDILFVCSGLLPVSEPRAGDGLPDAASAGGVEAKITAAQRAEFAAVVAADIGNCADAIPKRNAAADWILTNGG